MTTVLWDPVLWDPVPALTVAGVTIATGRVGGALPAQVALDGFEVTWGRTDIWEHPDPPSARVEVFDSTGRWATSTDLIGQLVNLSWTVTDPLGGPDTHTRTFYRGRVADVLVVPRELDGVDGVAVTLECVSLLVDLANTVPAEVWPQETMAQRRTRLSSWGLAGALPGGLSTDNNLDTSTTAAIPAAEQVSILEHIKQALEAYGPDRIAYLPDTQQIRQTSRRYSGARYTGRISRADPGATRYGEGAYIRSAIVITDATAGIATTGQWLDGVGVEFPDGDGITRDQASRMTRIRIEHLPTSITGDRLSTNYGIADEARGIRAIDVTVPHAVPTIAYQNIKVVAEGPAARWRLSGPLRIRGGLERWELARELISGGEGYGLFFLQRSILPRLGVPPVVGVIGGVIAHRGGEWDLELQTAPFAFTGKQHPIGWDEIDDGTPANTLEWHDGPHQNGLHETLTYEDMEWVGRGLRSDLPAGDDLASYNPPDYGWDFFA